MNYRDKVEENSLGEEGKNRVAAAVMQGLERKSARRPSMWKHVLAACASLLLIAAVVAPSVYFSVGKGEVENSGNTGDSVGGDIGPNAPGSSGAGGEGQGEINPDGIQGGFTRDGQVYYEVGETIKLTCKALTAHEISEPVTEGVGFTAVSVKLISEQPNSRGYVLFLEDGTKVLWTEYTYEVELEVTGEGTAPYFQMTFHTDNGLTLLCGFWGYRPQEGKHAGRVFCSHLSKDSAFIAYLDYMLNAGEIAKRQYDEMLSEYWRNSGVIEDS